MSVVKVEKLNKKFPNFELKDISFSLEEGHIVGFVGRNGAGKSTTIKSMLGMVNKDSGEVYFFDKLFETNEREIKRSIGYSTGIISWYPRKRIKDIVSTVRKFYDTWDEETYRKYLEMFMIDENKTPLELSDGMKVKINLLIALSHSAKVLILDEPTSSLDPFSRSELLDIFDQLKNEGITIFFSTHIIADIEKCADDIVYISKGRIVDNLKKGDFINKYSVSNETIEEIIIRMEKDVRNE